MPLPPPEASRQPLHTRSVRVQCYAREDELWDIEAELIDTKGYDFAKRDGSVLPAGQAVHHMHLRLTVDADYSVVSACAVYDASPYAERCACIESAYGDLAGMNLLKGFRAGVKDRFGRTAGCTHMTELAQILPTVALQAMSKSQARKLGPEHKPFQLDGCHALRIDGTVAQDFFPQWYRGPES